MLEIFKMKARGYAFVTVADKDADAFKAAIEGKEFRGGLLAVNDGKPRSSEDTGPKDKGVTEEESAAKRRKLSFPEGYTPTLRDIRDKDKGHKAAHIDKSVAQKSAPFLDFPYA